MKERVFHIVRESRVSHTHLMLESAPVSRLKTLLESEEGKSKIKKSLLSRLRDSSLVDAGLDILSGIGVSLEGGGAAASMIPLSPGASPPPVMIPIFITDESCVHRRREPPL